MAEQRAAAGVAVLVCTPQQPGKGDDRRAQRDVDLAFGEDFLLGLDRGSAGCFQIHITLDVGIQFVRLPVVKNDRAIAEAAKLHLPFLFRIWRGLGVHGPKHHTGLHALPGKEAGHRLAVIGQFDFLILEHPALERWQRRADHVLPISELHPGRAPGHAHNFAKTQACAPVCLQRRDAPLKCCVVKFHGAS